MATGTNPGEPIIGGTSRKGGGGRFSGTAWQVVNSQSEKKGWEITVSEKPAAPRDLPPAYGYDCGPREVKAAGQGRLQVWSPRGESCEG